MALWRSAPADSNRPSTSKRDHAFALRATRREEEHSAPCEKLCTPQLIVPHATLRDSVGSNRREHKSHRLILEPTAYNSNFGIS